MKKFLMVVLGVVLVTGLSGIFGVSAEAAVGTPANFENSGIYGGCAKSFAIAPDNSDVLYVGMGSGYGVYKSTNGGTSWSGNSAFENEGGSVEIRGLAVAPSNSNIVFASDGSTLKKSIDGGSTWTTLTLNDSGDQIQSIAIHPTDPDIVYLGTGSDQSDTNDDAKVWKTIDGGTNWTSSLMDDEDVNGSKNTLVGKVTIDPNNSDLLYAVTGSIVYTSASDLARGNIFRSTNGGSTWTAKYTKDTGWFEDVCVNPDDSTIIFAAGKVGIVKSIDSGDTWSTVLIPAGNGFCSVVINKDDDNIVYASEPRDARIYKSVDEGATWDIKHTAGVDIKLFIDPVTTTTIYAIDSVGVSKSIDSGANWTAVNSNIDAVEVISSAVDPTDHNIMYVGTESGYISKTTDKGSNWSVVHKEFYGITALAIDPTDTDIVYAADRGASILKSTDGGTNWTNMIADNDAYIDAFGYVNPTMMMVDPNNSSNVYICQKGQTGDSAEGNIYKSIDGGTWNALLDADNPVLSMAIKPSDSDTIYVGCNDEGGDPNYKGVVKTTNGGTTWASIGLAGEIIWVLVIDPNNEDVLYAGTEDTEEENSKVYKSTNAGDNWTDITPSGSRDIFETIAINSSDSNIVYVGAGSCIWKSTDAGTSWTLLTNAFISVKTLMIGSLYAGTGGGLYKYSPDTSSPDTSSSGSSSGCFIDTVR